MNPANIWPGYSCPKFINDVPRGLVVTETTKPRTSTLLPTYCVASESLITGTSSAETLKKHGRIAKMRSKGRTREMLGSGFTYLQRAKRFVLPRAVPPKFL